MAGRYWLGTLILGMFAVTGCGGGAPKGPSLDQQVKKAAALPDAGMRARQLAPLGEKQLAAGDVINGEKTLAFAAESAAAVEDPASKATALIAVGQAMGRAGK